MAYLMKRHAAPGYTTSHALEKCKLHRRDQEITNRSVVSHLSYSPNSLKGILWGLYRGGRGIKGDTRSLEDNSFNPGFSVYPLRCLN